MLEPLCKRRRLHSQRGQASLRPSPPARDANNGDRHSRLVCWIACACTADALAAPARAGTCTVNGPLAFTLAGLSLQTLQVSNVFERGVIDECTFTSAAPIAVLAIANCAQLVVSRCTVAGVSPGEYDSGSSAAVHATGSAIEWVGNTVLGGDGAGALGWDGQHALWFEQCYVWVTSSTASGGHGGAGGLCGNCGGTGALASRTLEW
jgi:hypothetical protein